MKNSTFALVAFTAACAGAKPRFPVQPADDAPRLGYACVHGGVDDHSIRTTPAAQAWDLVVKGGRVTVSANVVWENEKDPNPSYKACSLVPVGEGAVVSGNCTSSEGRVIPFESDQPVIIRAADEEITFMKKNGTAQVYSLPADEVFYCQGSLSAPKR